MSDKPKYTGLRCPACRKDVAIIENNQPPGLTFFCPACGNRWTADDPSTPKH